MSSACSPTRIIPTPPRCLLPSPSAPMAAAPSIPGVVPGQFDRPTGCLFSPRCRNAVEYCRMAEPKPAGPELGDALCHFPLLAGVPLGHPGREAAE